MASVSPRQSSQTISTFSRQCPLLASHSALAKFRWQAMENKAVHPAESSSPTNEARILGLKRKFFRVIVVVLVVAIGLGVGLGAGLTREPVLATSSSSSFR
jgi:hypothetical protein